MHKAKIDEDGLARASAYTLHNSLDQGNYSDYTVYGEEGKKYLNDLIDYYNDELNSTPILKQSKGSVERDKNGNIVYRGEKFPAFNKPIRDSGKKQGKVLVKQGKKIGIVRFGDPSLRDNYSNEANDSFYARFGGQKGLNNKFSPLYWSAKWLWPRGDRKGKGPKPFATIKKSEEEMALADSLAAEQDSEITSMLSRLISILSPKKKYSLHKEEDDDEFEDDDEDDDEEDLDDDFEEELDDDEEEDEDDPEEDEDILKEDSLNIVKQFDEEQMIAIEPLYINIGEADAHGDGITEEELDKLIDNFNQNIKNIKGNIHHAKMTDGFYPVKAYRMPMDVYVGNPNVKDSLIKIPEGQPIVKVQFCDTPIGKKLWEKRKAGVLKGVSIGAKGKRVENPDYQGED